MSFLAAFILLSTETLPMATNFSSYFSNNNVPIATSAAICINVETTNCTFGENLNAGEYRLKAQNPYGVY